MILHVKLCKHISHHCHTITGEQVERPGLRNLGVYCLICSNDVQYRVGILGPTSLCIARDRLVIVIASQPSFVRCNAQAFSTSQCVRCAAPYRFVGATDERCGCHFLSEYSANTSQAIAYRVIPNIKQYIQYIDTVMLLL